MVRRLFYVSFGAAAGVMAVRRAARLASSLSPESVAGSLVQSVESFVADVREAMAEREGELRGALGLAGDDESAGDEDADDDEEGDVTIADLAAANGRHRAF